MAKRLHKAIPPQNEGVVPVKLREIPRWINWDYFDEGEAKPRKKPIDAANGRGINYNTPEHWLTFEKAFANCQDVVGLGLGFVFSDADDIVGVDLDDCYSEDNTLNAWGAEVAAVFKGTFCEVTPSGNGLHYIGYAGQIRGKCRVELTSGGGVERYSQNRWFTITGDTIGDHPIADISKAMEWLNGRFFDAGERKEKFESSRSKGDELELARICLGYLDDSRYAIGDEWRTVGYAMRGVSVDLYDDWLEWSAQWPHCKPDECADRWERWGNSRSGLGTLLFLASADSGVPIAAIRGEVDGVSEERETITLVDAITEWRERKEEPTLKTGLHEIDITFGGGIPLGQMTAVAAAPGLGKSALGLQLMLSTLHHNGDKVGCWALGEMTKQALAARAITCASNSFLMFDGGLELKDTLAQAEEAIQASQRLIESLANRFVIVESPLRIELIEKSITQNGISMLVVDYLQLVRAGRHFQDKTSEINESLLKLRELTTKNNLATVLISNIAKGVDAKTEIGNIGKGSNQIDFDVDNFLFGERDGNPDGGDVKIRWHCKKLRQGEPGVIDLTFTGSRQVFTTSGFVSPFDDFADHTPAAVQREVVF